MKTRLKRIVLPVILGTVLQSGYAGKVLDVQHMSQPDNQTCLPTSLLMALHYMGKNEAFTSASVQELHKRTQYNRFNVPAIAKDFGLYAQPNWQNLGWTPDTVKKEIDEGRPVIIGVNQGRSGHFVLAIGYTDDDKVILHDPGRATDRVIGGASSIARWDEINWRGGIRLSSKPFPSGNDVSGLAIDDYGNGLEKNTEFQVDSGETRDISFSIINNGKKAWPAGVQFSAVDAKSSPTQGMKSLVKGPGWVDDTVVSRFAESNDVGNTVTVSFKVTAPEVSETTTILQYFNLQEPSGRWFSSDWNSGPSNKQMAVRLIVSPKNRVIPELNQVENGKDGKAELSWGVKFGEIGTADKNVPAAPDGLSALALNDKSHKWDSAWIGDKTWTDYRAESWIYCDLRKDEKSDGYQRVGLFMRDNGQHVGDNKDEVEIGRNICMMFDSDDGSIRAGDIFNGTVGDFRKDRYRVDKSGWYHFALEADGNTVRYFLNGELLHEEKNARSIPTQGDCGVYYNNHFKKDNPSYGVVFAGFKVSKLKDKGRAQREMEAKSQGWLDVSRTIAPGVPVWPGDPEVQVEKINDMAKGADHNLTKFSMVAHVGTHIDAPSHFIKDGAGADKMPLELMTGVVRVIEISPKATSIDVKHLEDMVFQKGDRVLFRTAMSEGEKDKPWTFEKNYVHLEPSAAQFLVNQGITFVGIDSFSVGGFNSDNAKVHSILLGNGIWIVENINLGGIRSGSYEYMCLPIKLKDSDGAPARMLIRPY